MRTEEQMENIQEDLHGLLSRIHDVISRVQKTPMDKKDIVVEELMTLSKNVDDGITSVRKVIGYLP